MQRPQVVALTIPDLKKSLIGMASNLEAMASNLALLSQYLDSSLLATADYRHSFLPCCRPKECYHYADEEWTDGKTGHDPHIPLLQTFP